MLTFILAVGIAISVSFICSIMEAAILSLNPGKLALLQQKNPKVGSICSNLKKNIEKPIAVILILNTAAHTFGASIAGAEFDEIWGSNYIWIFSLVFTIIMVQYTEILPKTLGVRFNSQVMLLTAQPLKFAIKILSPLISLIHFINKPFESSKKEEKTVAIEELDALATVMRKENSISKLQEYALHEIPDLHEDNVTKIMVPLDKTICVRTDMSKDDVLNIMKTYKHSRYPVLSSDSKTEVIGVIEVRKMMFCSDDNWQKNISIAPVINGERTLLNIAENIHSLDSKILFVKDANENLIGIVTINNLFMHLFPRQTNSSTLSKSDS